MYSLTRQEVAEKLGLSTRSVDRYIKSGKLRSKKEGKTIFIHETDVANLAGETNTGPEVIIPKTTPRQEYASTQSTSNFQSRETHIQTQQAASAATLEKIYIDLRTEIKQKDKLIQDLSIQLGQSQEIAKNSVSLVEFKKSQFLLEESKSYLNNETQKLREENETLHGKLKYEKSTNYILIAFCSLLVIAIGVVWFVKI